MAREKKRHHQILWARFHLICQTHPDGEKYVAVEMSDEHRTQESMDLLTWANGYYLKITAIDLTNYCDKL